MGVQGLKTLLSLHTSAVAVKLTHGTRSAAVDEGQNLVIVDHYAVENHFLRKLELTGETLYREVRRFFAILQRLGLRVVVVKDGAIDEGHAETHRRRATGDSEPLDPVDGLIYNTATIDAGVEFHQARSGADAAIFLLYQAHLMNVFAVISNDSDFFVYGVDRLAFIEEITYTDLSATFLLFNSAVCWAGLKRSKKTGLSHIVTPKQRYICAAILGNDMSKGTRKKIQGAQKSKTSTVHAISCNKAVRLFLELETEAAATLDFFRTHLKLTNFAEEDLETFNEVVAEYDTTAKQTLDDVLISPAMHWVRPDVIKRVATGQAPRSLIRLISRGVGNAGDSPSEDYLAFRMSLARKAFISGLKVPPLYSLDFVGHKVFMLGDFMEETLDSRPKVWRGETETKPTGPVKIESIWFDPRKEEGAKELKIIPVVEVPTADLAPRATFTETVEYLKSKFGGEDEVSLNATATSMFLLADDEKEVPQSETYQLLFESDTPPELHPLAERADEIVLSEGAMSISVGATLTRSDWNDIDNKEILKSVQASASYQTMTRLAPTAVPDPIPELDLDTLEARLEERASLKKEFLPLFKTHYPTFQRKKAKNAKNYDAATSAWVDKIVVMTSETALWLKRDAMSSRANKEDFAFKQAVAALHWEKLPAMNKKQALEMMHSYWNVQTRHGSTPIRRVFQQQLVDLLRDHLAQTEISLHAILSTPTGSGKTFTFLMLHLQELRDTFPDTIMIYTVPTKQVLKRVCQEVEAHKCVYWTVGASADSQYAVRRPYSIRTKKSAMQGVRMGAIMAQLENTMSVGEKEEDRGKGHPGIIVADLASTAAFMQASRVVPPSSPFHSSKLLLYLDEPDMGIHLDAKVLSDVKAIMENLPLTAVLASASLPNWDSIEPWWKSCTSPADRKMITEPPAKLPYCGLNVYHAESKILVPVSVFDIFATFEEYSEYISDDRRRLLLCRHFLPQQANDLINVFNSTNDDDLDHGKLWSDVGLIRSRILFPALKDLSEKNFLELKAKWIKEGRPKEVEDMGALLSQTGMTMVATLDCHRMALQFAGYETPRWDKTIHELKKKQKVAIKAAKLVAASKGRKRTARKGDDEDERDDYPQGDDDVGYVKLCDGLELTLEEIDQCDQETLAMMFQGIVYSSEGMPDSIRRVFLQAVRTVRETAKPASSSTARGMHTMVVEYSSIYGTDCPAVDTLILCADLAQYLSKNDHLQFLGRLRQDGKVVFMSPDILSTAVTGNEKWSQNVIEGIIATAIKNSQTSAEVLLFLQKAELLIGPDAHVAARAIAALLADAAVGGDAKPAAAKALKHIKQFKALLKTLTKVEAVRLEFLGAIETFCKSSILLPFSSNIIKTLYDIEVIPEESIIAWAEAAVKDTDDNTKTFWKKVDEVVTWLKEAEEEEDD